MTIEIPHHIAIVMDGNGRWAQRRGHSRIFGHVRGSSRIKAVVREASQFGVRALTLYAFSTENWSRPESEVQVLWRLLKKFLIREVDELHRQNVRLQVIGEVERLDSDVRALLDVACEKLSHNTGLTLTFALSYGARRELVRAAKAFAEDCVAGRQKPDALDEAGMQNYLWTSSLGEFSDVDLFIRTSGERRVSNFLLWQAAYAEFVFSEVCWPDFAPKDLRSAIEEYSKRERRFGSLNRR